MKLRYGCLLIRNGLSVIATPSVWPTLMPSRTLHMRGSPSQPSRFLPLNSGWNPSCAKAAAAKASDSSMRLMALAPPEPAGFDAHFLQRPVLFVARRFGNLLHHLVAFRHFTENSVAVVEPRSGCHGHEELAAVGVRSGIGHRQESVLGVLQRGMKFVGELVARPAGAGACRIAALDQEIGTHAVRS